MNPAGSTVVPGRLLPKLVVLLIGLSILAAVAAMVARPVLLMINGTWTEAEVSRVIQVSGDGPEVGFTDPAALAAAEQLTRHDQRVVYAVEWAYPGPGGELLTMRWDHGSRFRTPVPLLDADGLPTRATLVYDPKDPARAELPMDMRTWFAPFMIMLLGVIVTAIGGFLVLSANKPFVLDNDLP